MQILGSSLIGTDILSLHTGSRVGQVKSLLIEPSNLKVVALEIHGPLFDKGTYFLMVPDIREYSHMGIIIDSTDDIIEVDDIVKLRKLYDTKFYPIGMNVIDETKRKLGKVEDYTIDIGSFVVIKLQVRRRLLSSFNDTGMLIDRSQVVEITDTTIIVKTTAKKTVAETKDTASYNYVNPFRKTSTQPDMQSD